MIKVDKSYTIKYSKGGIVQYADFRYSDGKLVNHSFIPNWVKSDEVPSLDGLEDIVDILEVIKKFSYSNQADIYLIDGNYPGYYDSGTIEESLKKAEKSFDEFTNVLCLNFFVKEILPIINRNEWKVSYSWCHMPVLIKKVDDEWDNINTNNTDSKVIELISGRFLNRVLRLSHDIELRSEHGYIRSDCFAKLFGYLDESDLKKLGVLIELPKE